MQFSPSSSGPRASTASGIRPAVRSAVRVLTINIWARYGPYAERAALLRRELAILGPDLIALQEVDVGPGDSNQAEELGSRAWSSARLPWC
jgi:endonuclease/exonuclease/phosphatase family metal-dependent hydrolase